MSVTDKVNRFRSLVRLLLDVSEVIVREWEAEAQKPSPELTPLHPPLPSAELYNARRVILGACGMCMDLVQEPQSRLMEMGTQYFISRALHIAAEGRIADVLADADPEVGVPIQDISKKVGVEEQKLARVLRCLCTVHIFTEVQKDHFANSPTSQHLVDNEPLRCNILIHGMDVYAASNKLPAVLFDPIKTQSYSPRETAFQEAAGTSLSWWEYFEEGVRQPDGTVTARPELEIFNLAMLGGGRVQEVPLYADYPWEALGTSTVVDVGGGVGMLFSFPVHDESLIVTMPIKGAEVYWMRYILHDWADDECVTILAHLREAMGPKSRILIADQVIHPTSGSSYLTKAPSPLPANYGWAHKFSNQHDMTMLSIHNGMERTPDNFKALAERAGLRIVKIWECRGLAHITEMRRTDAHTSSSVDCCEGL
ncbi:hypothetical protein AcV5_006947 [Taiwanofungus camphoratus]|nr:hypothetical protein AcV5_006947 [Antrodia cinnamomea]